MTETAQTVGWQVQRVPTGVPNLDRLIDGGLTRGGFMFIVGGPGTGKTVLAEQMVFHWASLGQNVLWLVTLGEPNEKFLMHASQMSFFDRGQVGATIQLVNLSRYLRQGLQEQLSAVRETIHSGSYTFVVIDGFQGWRAFLEDQREVRLFLSELSSELSLAGTTLVVTADAGLERHWEDPVFTMADGLVVLSLVAADGRERRWLEVVKLRGRPTIGGQHSFTIDGSGLHVHPRAETILPRRPAEPVLERESLGVPGLDDLLGGGVYRGSATLLAGSPGTGKSLLASYFLAAGLRQSQQCLQLCFFEDVARFLQRGSELHLPLRQALDSGQLAVSAYEPGAWDPDSCAEHVYRAVEERGIRRLVIDGIDALVSALGTNGRTLEYMSALTGYLRLRQVTALFTYEQPALFDPVVALPSPVTGQPVDNLVLLRFAESEGRLRRLLSVIKTRYTGHSPVLAEVLIEQGQVNVVPHPRQVEDGGDSLVYYGEVEREHLT